MSSLPTLLRAGRAPLWGWWLVPTLFFAAVIGWEIDWGRGVVVEPFSPAPIDPVPVTPQLLPEYAIEGGLAANSETVNRTLFNPTRRPAPPLADEGGPRSFKPGQFQLVGTTVTGDKNIAFLKEVQGGKSHAVLQGDKINGLLVASVKADRVKLMLGSESEELVLKVAPGPKTTLAAAPAAPNGPPAVAPGAPASAPPPRAAGRGVVGPFPTPEAQAPAASGNTGRRGGRAAPGATGAVGRAQGAMGSGAAGSQ